LGAQGVPLLDNGDELQALFVEGAQAFGLRAQGGVLFRIIAVRQARKVGLHARSLAFRLLHVALDGGQAAQFDLQRVRLLQVGLERVQLSLHALLRLRVIHRNLVQLAFQLALLALEGVHLAQFGLQLAQVRLLFGKVLLELVACVLLLGELLAQGVRLRRLLLERVQLRAQGAQLAFGSAGFLSRGCQHRVVGVAERLPAGGTLARFAQRFELLHACALLLQGRLQAAQLGFHLHAPLAPRFENALQSSFGFEAGALELLEVALGLLHCMRQRIARLCLRLKVLQLRVNRLQLRLESGALGGLLSDLA
jgi:hypothetical protein